VNAGEIIDILVKFRRVDKYEAFHEILPAVLHTTEQQKTILSDILDNCSDELLRHFREVKKPDKKLLRQYLVECMDAISIADINAENKEFGYQLGWYLAEKVNVNLKKGTEKKIWGYWHIEANEVKIPVRPRISPNVKKKGKTDTKK